MNGLILYIIKSTLYTAVFQSFYLLVMRKTTFFRLNRVVFITGTFLCMFLPFINIEMPAETMTVTPMEMIEAAIISDSPAETTAAIEHEVQTNWTGLVMFSIFLVGAVISLCVTTISYIRMSRMIRSVRPVEVNGNEVRIVDAEIPSFSWGRHIVIGRKDMEENPSIMTHEQMHVRCRHSFDLMAYTIVTTLQWFNPLVWISRTELKMLHEYEADELTISKGIDATQYQLLLVKKAVGAKRFQLANGFNHSKLKNRITMMHRNKTNKWMRLAYVLCVPALILTMCLCSNPKGQNIDEIRFDGLSISALTPDAKAEFKDFSAAELDEFIKNCGVDPKFITIEIKPCDDKEVVERFKDYLRKNEIYIVNLPLTDGQEASTEKEAAEGEPIPFQLIEDKPTFQGGDANTFSRWVNSNLTYPAEANEKGIQGRVTISFTVSSTGKVCDVKVIRGVDPLLDNEAVRVVEMSPDWTPGMKDGKPVAVTYVFPVIFLQRDTDKKTEAVPFQFADTKPGFNGGDANEFNKWVAQQVVYPENCKKEGIAGRVTLSFIVNETGKVSDVKVLRGVHEDLDKEAVRVVSSSPDWTPGMKDGKAVPVKYTFPVIFSL